MIKYPEYVPDHFHNLIDSSMLSVVTHSSNFVKIDP